MGGLGNQLYQIFTTIAFSLKMSRPFFFKYESKLPGPVCSRDTYWDTFLLKLNPYVLRDSNECQKRKDVEAIVKEEGHDYSPISLANFPFV